MKRLAFIVALLSALAPSLHAGWTHAWVLGTNDNTPDEFGSEAYPNNAAPTAASATTRDDDYYFAGTYAAPVGVVATAEPVANFENALSTWDPISRVHFNLTASQASSTSKLRVFVLPIWGGYDSGKNFGTHTLTLKLNNVTILTRTFSWQLPVSVMVNASAVNAVAGENVLELSRSGGTANGWFNLDQLGLDVNATALVDADSDGMPQWWEEMHGLSDGLAADAAQDPDHDGSTNLQEFTRGTDPHNADTDGDGLLDGAETTTNPLVADTDGDSIPDGQEVGSNPLLIDSDSDGAPDAWELRVGTNPLLGTSTPPAFNAVIGVHFTSEAAPANTLTPYMVAGLVPQMNWNNTRLLREWSSADIAGGTADIVSPTAGVLKNSAGVTTAATVSWTADATAASGNSGTPTQELLNSALWVSGDTPAVVSFASVPYASYDVVVYVASSYEGAIGYVRLNDNATTDRWFSSDSSKPQAQLIEPAANNATRPWRGNVLRFRNVSGAAFNVKLYRTDWHAAGITAVQIVNRTQDTDGDGIPDWYEVTYGLNPAVNDAALDPDGDGLTNVQEYARGTDPKKADTDGDGLSDKVETNTGTYVSTTDTGSNPLIADTDGDGLSDGTEVNMLPAPLNPNLTDSDTDGRSDALEVQLHTDPLTFNVASALMPVVTTSPRTFTWTVPIQMVWDRTRGMSSDGEWGDTEMIWMVLRNREAPTSSDALGFGIRMVEGRLTWLFYSSAAAAFSAAGQPTNDIWHSDWNRPPTDLRAAMGFSGHGRRDISDRLRLRVSGSSTGSASAWNITASVFNLDTNATVATQTFNNCTLVSNVHANAVTWTDSEDVANQFYLDIRGGVSLYFLGSTSAPSIKTMAAFANDKDTDKDGMSDVWELANSFNPNSAADAALDTDGDGLTNVQEFDLGTNPRNADTDGDGAKDGVEVTARSNPLLASSKPAFWNGLPAGVSGEDLNGNGISDAFELWIGRFDLNGNADSDGDGMTNAQEARAGTDPLSPLSRLWADSTRAGSNLTLRWPRLANKLHQAQQSTDLVTWTTVSGSPVVAGNEYQQTITNAFTGGRKFYRASVSDLDSDGDGVSDWAEVNVLGSSTSNANSTRSSTQIDTNGDGIPDTTISGDYASFVERMQGGGSGGGFAGASGSPVATNLSRAQAARFLMQASFGPTVEDIDRVRELGYDAWITEQMALTPTLHSTYISAILADFHGPRADMTYSQNEDNIFGINMNTAFARAAIQGQDQLRQRVAFALSQILVTSRRDANLEGQLRGMADYYDIFVRRAFGNYNDILMDVTLHPCMGRYLSHVGNQKANPAINQFPDENYAREVMQLFSIGLWELNPDGTRKVNGGGQNIPTYSNTEITQLARVMTGLWFGEHDWGGGGWDENDYATPMTMHADKHDFDAKTLVGGYVIPAREPSADAAMQDVRDAIRHLFEQPNTAPFISRQLIQFLVTDNPSPAYVQRVAAKFADNGSGVRGDLGAVVRAILLDDEARNPANPARDTGYGKLKEPVIRAMAVGRAFGLKTATNPLWWNWGEFYEASRQEPGYSPSVFNFYRPDYKAPGLLTTNGKQGPVFQITDSSSAISFPNQLWDLIVSGFVQWHAYQFPLDLARESALAATPELLVDHLNLLFCAGQMGTTTRTTILSAINQVPATNPEGRARVAIYLTTVCPEGAVMK